MTTRNPPKRNLPKQITFGAKNHQLTNHNIWTSDSNWIVYDCRSQPAIFNGENIERVNIVTGQVELIYHAKNGAHVGVVTVSSEPNPRYIFIHGPEHPTELWQYNFHYRRGVIAQKGLVPEKKGTNFSREQSTLLDTSTTSDGTADQNNQYYLSNFDSFYETEPLKAGMLHGGSHVHIFSPDNQLISFTYNDYLLHFSHPEIERRNIGIGFYEPNLSNGLLRQHEQQYFGHFFCVLMSKTVANAVWGSDDIEKAYEEGWIGNNGYINSVGAHQKYAIAFLGDTRDSKGNLRTEIFKVDLPEDFKQLKFEESDRPLSGTSTQLPHPPKGIFQHRLTFSEKFGFNGVCTQPRHWLRSSPDGKYIAFLMFDNNQIAQLWLISTLGGVPKQVSQHSTSIQSSLSWHPSGKYIAFALNQRIAMCHWKSGETHYLTDELNPPPKPEAVVCSPDGKMIAFTRNLAFDLETDDISGKSTNRKTFTEPYTQIFIIAIPNSFLSNLAT